MNAFLKWKCLLFSLLILYYPIKSYAGVTGTLAGTVIDGETGEPLPGANVILVDTQLGAAADEKGRYLIQNIRPGTYKVSAAVIGYTTMTKTGVRILVDRRTNVHFELTPEALSLGKEIVVTAPKELIQMDVTGSQHEVRGDLIKSMPVNTPEEIVNLQPGVVEGHIRGGRETEVLYLVDGVPVQEAILGGRGITIPNVSIADMTILTGGFNAEYGNAMSGVINIISHEGTDEHKFYAEGFSDDAGVFPGSWDDTHFDRFRNVEVAAGGPMIDGIYYYVAGQYIASDTRWRRPFRSAFGGPIEQQLHGNAKLSINFHPTQKLVLQALYSASDWRAYEHRWLHNLSGLPPREKNSYRLNASWTHTLSEKTFYTAKISYYDVLKSVLGKQQEQYEIDIEFDENGLFILDGEKAWWQDSQEIISTARIDLVSQVSHTHQIKTGVDFTYYDLFMNNIQIEPFPPDFHPELPPEFRFNVYNTHYRYYPKMGSFYIQDKIDLERLSLNLGIRFDYLDPSGQRPAIESIEKKNDYEIQVFTSTRPTSVKSQWSPRLGLSFPVSENDKIHLNYGHFFQAPLFDYLYTNLDYNFSGYNPLVGNPDLEPEKTSAIEVGYEREISENTMFSVTLFNKDITNLVDVQYFEIPVEETGLYSSGTYTRYVNLAYGNAKGIEFFLRKKYGESLKGQASYSLMSAKGSSFAVGDKANMLQYGGLVKTTENYLSWDQRHTFAMYLDYQQPKSWGANVVWRINSPKPYTLDEDEYENNQKVIYPNNKRLDWTNCLDIKLKKMFDVGFGIWGLQMEIRNVLDSKNLLWRDMEGRIGGMMADPAAYDVGRRLKVGVVWQN